MTLQELDTGPHLSPYQQATGFVKIQILPFNFKIRILTNHKFK